MTEEHFNNVFDKICIFPVRRDLLGLGDNIRYFKDNGITHNVLYIEPDQLFCRRYPSLKEKYLGAVIPFLDEISTGKLKGVPLNITECNNLYLDHYYRDVDVDVKSYQYRELSFNYDSLKWVGEKLKSYDNFQNYTGHKLRLWLFLFYPSEKQLEEIPKLVDSLRPYFPLATELEVVMSGDGLYLKQLISSLVTLKFKTIHFCRDHSKEKHISQVTLERVNGMFTLLNGKECEAFQAARIEEIIYRNDCWFFKDHLCFQNVISLTLTRLVECTENTKSIDQNSNYLKSIKMAYDFFKDRCNFGGIPCQGVTLLRSEQSRFIKDPYFVNLSNHYEFYEANVDSISKRKLIEALDAIEDNSLVSLIIPSNLHEDTLTPSSDNKDKDEEEIKMNKINTSG